MNSPKWLRGVEMFGRRKKWNNKVMALLPAFDLKIEELGEMKALEALDLVYHKGFSEHEGALYLAYLGFGGFISGNTARADEIKAKIAIVQPEWVKLGRVKSQNALAWQQKSLEWERKK